jgi:FkbM family methyltransferase
MSVGFARPIANDDDGAAKPAAPAPPRRLPAWTSVTAAAVTAAARMTKWLEPELLGLSSLVGPGSVCFDVGSAAGLYTVQLSRLAGPSGLVHSVEPLPFAWSGWNRVLRSRHTPNVRHHCVALSAQAGQASMSVPMGRYGLVTGRSFISQHCQGLGSNAEFSRHIDYPVPVTTLDGLVSEAGLQRLDFIKIDVEGAELHVLRGGTNAIESFRPAMLIEIEGRHTERYEYTPADVVSWLLQRGYEMFMWQGRWQPVALVSEQTRNYLFRAAEAA